MLLGGVVIGMALLGKLLDECKREHPRQLVVQEGMRPQPGPGDEVKALAMDEDRGYDWRMLSSKVKASCVKSSAHRRTDAAGGGIGRGRVVCEACGCRGCRDQVISSDGARETVEPEMTSIWEGHCWAQLRGGN